MKHLKFLIVALGLVLFSNAANAVTLISTASGNIDTTGTWSVVDSTGTNAFLNSETANTALTTSPVASSTFTPAAEAVTSIGVRLASVAAAPSGTLTVKLANSTSAGNRECTLSVNVADLVSASATQANGGGQEGGWIILACSASPNGTDAYTITANTSVSSQVNLFSLATTNWSRLLVTSGTQASGPAAGDKFLVYGVLTGAGTHNAFSVTIETTANTNFGNVANTTVDPSISVGQFGTLAFATSAATNYKFQHAGPMIVYNGGTFNHATAGTPIPSTSTATYTLNSTATGDTGLVVRNGGTHNVAGVSGGRSVVRTTLPTAAAGGATSLITTASTGWLSGDSIFIAASAQPASQSTASYKGDATTLSGNATGTTVPVSAIANAHPADNFSYTSTSTGVAYALNMYADVILLNRNVIIQGSGAAGNGYIYYQANSVAALTWVEFSQISGSAVKQRGVESDTGPGGSFSLTNFSFVNCNLTPLTLGGINPNFGGVSGTPVLVQHGSIYNVGTNAGTTAFGLAINPTLASMYNPNWKVDDIAVILSGNGNFADFAILAGLVNGTFTNISISGGGIGGSGSLKMAPPYVAQAQIIGGSEGNTWGPITIYAGLGTEDVTGGSFGPGSGTINGLYIWRSLRFNPLGEGRLVIDPFYDISGSFGVYNIGRLALTVRNGVIAYENVSTTGNYPVTLDANNGTELYLDNMDLCPTGSLGTLTVQTCGIGPISLVHDLAPTGGDIVGNAHVYLRNTSILSQSALKAYPFQGWEQAYYGPGSFAVQDCNACSPVKHMAWVPYGTVAYDTTITHSTGFSARMVPFVPTFSGSISGGTLTSTTNTFNAANGSPGTKIASNGAGFVAGSSITGGGSGTTLTVTPSQTTCSPGAPCQFQSYNNPFNDGVVPRMQSAPLGMGTRVAVASGVSNATACVWIRPSISTDGNAPWGTAAVTYNGDNPRMIVRQNPYMGVQSDTILATSSPTAGAWSQFCGTLPTAPADGEFEVVVDADQTFTSAANASVNVAEWSCTNCGAANGSQFWWNGTPSIAIAPASAGGGGKIIGGFLLRRDIDPGSNDNDPMWLQKVA